MVLYYFCFYYFRCVYLLIVSKYGSIRLGKDDDEPDYSYMTWFAMLFSAGMGIGLVFWGVAEPLNHLYAPPFGESATEESARLALRFHFSIGDYILGDYMHL